MSCCNHTVRIQSQIQKRGQRQISDIPENVKVPEPEKIRIKLTGFSASRQGQVKEQAELEKLAESHQKKYRGASKIRKQTIWQRGDAGGAA